MFLTPTGYLPRIVDDEIDRKMDSFGAVLVRGPMWCGKTWTSLNHASSAYYVGDPSGNYQNRRLAEMDPSQVLRGEEPRVVDEWQEVPPIWDATRFEVDRERRRGRFLLTGSSTPKREGAMHSGSGRVGVVDMRPMTLSESGDSSGEVSLQGLFDAPPAITATGEVSLSRIAELIVRGGWPGNLGLGAQASQDVARSYVELFLDKVEAGVEGVRRDRSKMAMLLRSLARNESTLAADATLRRDMLEYDDQSLAAETVADYLGVLRSSFLLWEQPAWSPGLRSPARVGKKPKRHLADPSLAAALVGATPERLIGDLETFGFFFEGLAARDIAVYARSFGGRLFHYRDGAGREIDVVVELEDGRWGAFEVKLGANQIDTAAKSLLSTQEYLASHGVRSPSVLCVVCGLSNAAYMRSDGVAVVPLLALAR